MNSTTTEKLREREVDSTKRLIQIRDALAGIGDELQQVDDRYDVRQACIYATGSYARGEASESSDLDIFIVDSAADGSAELGNLGGILLKAQIIKRCHKIQLAGGGTLPAFSRDGAFLTVHRRKDFERLIGGIEDDPSNTFTARMLMILESKHLLHEEVYNATLSSFLELYFRLSGTAEDFVPRFFINDVARFWKTLCLNFENRRSSYAANMEFNPSQKAHDTHDRLKLKFSRIMTCYSMLTALAEMERSSSRITHSDLTFLSHKTPIERLEWVADTNTNAQSRVDHLFESYLKWLDFTLEAPQDRKKKLRDDTNFARGLLSSAEDFSSDFYELLNIIGREGKVLRSLTV